MSKKPTFVGFNTIGDPKVYSLTDINLVKQDLLNTFMTVRGERLMRPEFGSIIHETIHEPLDATTRQRIRDDVERIVNIDPRVRFDDVAISEFEHGILIELSLYFDPSGAKDVLEVRFNRQDNSNA